MWLVYTCRIMITIDLLSAFPGFSSFVKVSHFLSQYVYILSKLACEELLLPKATSQLNQRRNEFVAKLLQGQKQQNSWFDAQSHTCTCNPLIEQAPPSGAKFYVGEGGGAEMGLPDYTHVGDSHSEDRRCAPAAV